MSQIAGIRETYDSNIIMISIVMNCVLEETRVNTERLQRTEAAKR
jgi:hypothetical protein